MSKERLLVRTIAWLTGVGTILASLCLILLYGHSFGYIKSILWLTAFLTSVATSLLIVEPLKQIASAVYLTMCTRSTHFDIDQDRPVMSNQFNECQKAFNTYSQKVVHDQLCWDQEQDPYGAKLTEKYLIYYRELTSDLFVFLLYVIALLLIVLGSRDGMALYSNRMVTMYTVDSKFVRGPLKPIIGDQDFHDFLSQVLVPSLQPSKDYNPLLLWIKLTSFTLQMTRTCCTPAGCPTRQSNC